MTKSNIKRIPLTKGKFALVDMDDYERVSAHKWHINNEGYANGWIGNSKRESMHRFILNARRGQEIDHINGDRIDNRKTNLRFCTRKQNISNMGATSRNSSGYKGVFVYRPKSIKSRLMWQVSIMHDGISKHLGYFENREEAARVYDCAALKYHGEFARTNKSMGLLD